MSGAHGFESQAHCGRFAEGLRNRLIPLKLAYTGSAAQTHDRLARSAGYQQVIGPVVDEVKVCRQTLGAVHPPPQIVEIGPGNGVHSAAFLTEIANGAAVAGRYLALDFSRSLLQMARRRIEETCGEHIDVATALWDIEQGECSIIDEWREGGEPIVICLLGNTIGNVEDPVGALQNIAASAREGDLLLISVTLAAPSRGSRSMLAPYETEVFEAAVLEPFAMAGIPRESLKLSLSAADDVVEGVVQVIDPISFEGVEVPEGEQIRCFVSRRFTESTVGPLLMKSGWEPEYQADSGDHLVVAAVRG